MFPTKEFKIELIKHDLTGRAIARHFRVHPTLISLVIHNQPSSARIYDKLNQMLCDMRKGKFKRLEDY